MTERNAARQALLESERRIRAVFDHAGEAIALLTPDGRVLEINRAAAALTVDGRPVVGAPLWEVPWLGADLDAAPEAGQPLRDAIAPGGGRRGSADAGGADPGRQAPADRPAAHADRGCGGEGGLCAGGGAVRGVGGGRFLSRSGLSFVHEPHERRPTGEISPAATAGETSRRGTRATNGGPKPGTSYFRADSHPHRRRVLRTTRRFPTARAGEGLPGVRAVSGPPLRNRRSPPPRAGGGCGSRSAVSVTNDTSRG